MARDERLSTTLPGRPLLLLGLLIAAAFLARGVAASESHLPLHPSIAAWTEEHPGEPVPLIVQHDGTPDDLLTFVGESGGALEREFHIIPAIDIDLPASELDDLVRQDDVVWLSLDAPLQSTKGGSGSGYISTAYPFAVNAPQAWQDATGSGVTVALIDTGVSKDAEDDFLDASGDVRVTWMSTNPELDPDEDGFGHGTHVGGIIAGASTKTNPAGKYTGIAPEANLLSVRIADDEGGATVGDLLAALQFVDDNRDTYDVKVLNLSVTSSIAQSYLVDPIDAAVELLWFHGVTVVVAAGNDGDAADAVHYPPANDPFVITVGAFDDMGTADHDDDEITWWSSRGTTQDGFDKPEVLAPGAGIVSPVSRDSYLAQHYPEAIVEDAGNWKYFRMSGTSMATGAASGLAALVRQAHPGLLPGEVKDVLLNTVTSLSGEGERLRADRAVAFDGTPKSTDDGITPNLMLLAGVLADAVDAGDVEIGENGIRWRDADGVWHETSFEGIRWRDLEFDGIRWRGLEFDGIRWRDVDFSGIRWRNVEFDGIRWGGADLDTLSFEGIRWRGFVED